MMRPGKEAPQMAGARHLLGDNEWEKRKKKEVLNI
jgi:hypothetical protein